MKKELIAKELVKIAKELIALDVNDKEAIVKKMKIAQDSLNGLSIEAKELLNEVARKEKELEEAKARAKAFITKKPPKGMDDSDYQNWNEQNKALKEAMDLINDLGQKSLKNTQDAQEFSEFIEQLRKEFADVVSKITAKESTKVDYGMIIQLLETYISNTIGKKVSAIAAETKNYTVVMGLASGLLTDFRNSKLMEEVAAKIQERSDVVEGLVPNWEGKIKDRGWKIEEKSLKTFLDEASNRQASVELKSGKQRNIVIASKYRRAGAIDTVMKLWKSGTQKIKNMFNELSKWIKGLVTNVKKAIVSSDKLSNEYSDGMKVLKDFQKELKKIK